MFDEKTVYVSWKNELEIWRRVTDLSKEKQALAVTLTLTGTAKQTALNISANDLNKDDGMDKLIEALDGVFLREKKDLAYDAYSAFDKYRRSSEPMTDFIVEFEQRYNLAKKHEMTLPDAVLAFKLLDGAGLEPQERQLALTATVDLTFASMKSALKRIFTGDGHEASAPMVVKQETAYVTERYRPPYRRSHQSQNWRSDQVQKTDEGGSQKGTNPLNRFGRRSRCAICESVFHWAKDCPHKGSSAAVKLTTDQDEDDESEECNLTLYTKEEIFMTESFGAAVLDTACTRTVCGRKWLDNYLESLNDENLDNVQHCNSNRKFKFGDGVSVKATENVVIPAQIGEKKCNINTDVVDSDIPLLLSKESLKRARTILNLEEDKAEMFQEPVPLHLTSSGHYCVDISIKQSTEDNDPSVLIVTEAMSEKEQKKKLVKIHRQFGHALPEKMRVLLENAGNRLPGIDKILKEIVDECEVCVKYKRTKPRPAVGFPLGTEFNETVAVDLHQLDKGLWYLHIIDEFTRFSAGAIMRSKQPAVFVELFIKHWISVFGPCKRLFSDNGGEFSNDEVRDMCQNFNIEVLTTAAYSPWSNGLLERHNKILTETLMKIRSDNQNQLARKFNWETALAWALMAKNCLSNVHGYSSYQLVFGRNPVLPSILTDKLPALEGVSSSYTVANHINSLFSARKAFLEAESSERLRRALRKNTRPANEYYQSGDKVYYKRPDSQQWKGPARVIGQDGVVVFLRHGGLVVRVHTSRLQKANHIEMNAHQTTPVEEQDESTSNNTENKQAAVPEYEEDDQVPDARDQTNDPEVEQNQAPVSRATIPEIKPGQLVAYRRDDKPDIVVAKVLSRAGKVHGKNKDWWNLEYMLPEDVEGIKQSVDLSKVKELQENYQDDQDGNQEVMMSEDVALASMDRAKQLELESWRVNDVFTEVENRGQRAISTRWVCTLKETVDGLKPKARLVARGFEDVEQQNVQKDSPTCGKEALRMILAVFADNDWIPHALDVKTAFLQGQQI